MNKHLYRIVFSEARGLFMVVGELVIRKKRVPGTTSRRDLRGAKITSTGLRPVAFSALAALGLLVSVLPIANAQIVADRNAPKNQQPTVLRTANGLPQVNIQTPSAAGVSRNAYSQFDVERKGAILNNGRTTSQTRLAGQITGNWWLATGTARVILNEVNSSDPSLLGGYVEVAGDRAQVVIANPAGIFCDGCGFINTSRATLTTGRPIIKGGDLEGYRVQRGGVTIKGKGLDASQTDYTDIIARSVQLNSSAWAQRLNVTTGANRVNADNTKATPTAGSGPRPTVALDVARLGGMYAGKIMLVGTEAGVGVRNAGRIAANVGDVIVTTDGTLQNTGRITSTADTRIDAQEGIDNSANGVISSKNTHLTAGETLTNRGLIDGQHTVVKATDVNNLGTGRIYGDHLSLAATTVTNDIENAAAPVIAARERLDIGAGTINNREHAVIFSAGDMHIGGRLDADDHAAGQAGTVNNNSATIEAAGDLDLAARAINNTNEHFSTQVVEVGHQEGIQEYQGSGSGDRFSSGQVSLDQDQDGINILVTPPTAADPDGRRFDDYNEYTFNRITTETQIAQSDPGQILAGGAMDISADVVFNDKSQIIAGGTLTGDIGTLTNTEVAGDRVITDSGTVIHSYREEHDGRDDQKTDSSPYVPAPIVQAITLRPAVFEQNAAVPPVNTEVPNSSLFRQNPDVNAHVLVETDPRFADFRTWLSSDYLLKALNVDPAASQQRLGDGFYEQKLLREQVAQLTGKRFLDGYASDEAEYRGLIDNAVTYAKRWDLRPGVALSAEQVAQLTSDIVWLVEKDVTLPNGKTTKALVPQIYVAVKDGDLDGSGALISADAVNFNLQGDLNNSGSIAARTVMSLSAENVKNLGGRISGQDVAVAARTDLDNLGGSLTGGASLRAEAGRDLNVVSTTHGSRSEQGSRTNIDRVAGLFVSRSEGTLVATAGRDANLIAANIVNSGEGGTTAIAAGRDLNLGTVTESNQIAIVWDANNYRKEASRTDVGTTIQTSGDLRLSAGQDVNAKAADVSSEQGGLLVTAGRNVNVLAGESSVSVDEGHQRKGSNGLFSQKTTRTRDTLDATTAVASTLSADTTTVVAGTGAVPGAGDIRVKGSNIVSTHGTTLIANNDINIEAATNTRSETHSKVEKQSGLMRAGTTGVFLGTQKQTSLAKDRYTTAAGSTVGSTDADVRLQAGNAYTQIGSDVVAPQGNIDIDAKNVDIRAAQNTHQSERETRFQQSGFTLAGTNPVVSAMETGQRMNDAAAQTKNARLKVLAAATTGLAARNAYDAVKSNPTEVGGGSVSLSYGLSESRSRNSSSSTTAVSSKVAAGGDVNIHASGAGANSHITVQGSQVSAGRDATLDAEGNLNLLAAKNTSEQHTKSQSGSASVGMSYGSDGWTATAGVSASRGRSDGQDSTWTNTRVDAGNRLTLKSGADTNLKGAVASGTQVVAQVGRNLNIESLQDTSTYHAKEQSASINVAVPIGTSGAPSGSFNANQLSLRSDYASVTEQSGIKAGDQGFQVDVTGNTDLKGAVIASTDKAVQDGKNSLTTGTLTESDIANKAEYQAQSVSIGGGYSTKTKQFSATPPSVMNAHDSASSTTQSGVSGGMIQITDEKRQQELTGKDAASTIASLNRDVASDKDTSNKLDRIFDETEIRTGFEITGAFAREATTFLENRAKEADEKRKKAKDARDLAYDDKKSLSNQERSALINEAKALRNEAEAITDHWGPGGTFRQITTALVAAASGNVTASSAEFAKNAVVNFVQQQGASYIGKLVRDGTLTEGSPEHTALHAIVACAGAAGSGQGCANGAAGAAASSLLTHLFKPKPEETNSDLERNRNLLTSLVAGIAAMQDSGASTAVNSAVAAADNNWLTVEQAKQRNLEMEKAKRDWEKFLVRNKWARISREQQKSGKEVPESEWNDLADQIRDAHQQTARTDGTSDLSYLGPYGNNWWYSAAIPVKEYQIDVTGRSTSALDFGSTLARFYYDGGLVGAVNREVSSGLDQLSRDTTNPFYSGLLYFGSQLYGTAAALVSPRTYVDSYLEAVQKTSLVMSHAMESGSSEWSAALQGIGYAGSEISGVTPLVEGIWGFDTAYEAPISTADRWGRGLSGATQLVSVFTGYNPKLPKTLGYLSSEEIAAMEAATRNVATKVANNLEVLDRNGTVISRQNPLTGEFEPVNPVRILPAAEEIVVASENNAPGRTLKFWTPDEIERGPQRYLPTQYQIATPELPVSQLAVKKIPGGEKVINKAGEEVMRIVNDLPEQLSGKPISPAFRTYQEAYDSGNHVLQVVVYDEKFNQIAEWFESSEKGSAFAGHTEQKAFTRINPQPGMSIHLQGELPPCNFHDGCHEYLNNISRDKHIEIRYDAYEVMKNKSNRDSMRYYGDGIGHLKRKGE